MNPNDPVTAIFQLLMSGEEKEKALQRTTGVELLLANKQYDKNTAVSVYNILAGVYVWNEEYEKATISQAHFLSDKEWCETYEETVESYLALVFVKNNKDFIELTLENHPIIRTNFKDLYKSYLSMIVDPNDEENYNPNNMYYYQLLQRAQNLYC